MTNSQLQRTCEFYERTGFIGQELSDLMQEDVAKSYIEEQIALIYFGAIDAEEDKEDKVRPFCSGDWHEEIDLIGEIYSDYSEAMKEFQAAISDENSPINVWADDFLKDMDFA